MKIEDYKVKNLVKMFTEQELDTLYNDCSRFNFFQKRDINTPVKEMYNKLFASGNHVIINDIIDIRSFISNRTVEVVTINPKLMTKVYKFKYSRSIKYQITYLLCKALNYKRYQPSDSMFYNRAEVHLNYCRELYLLIKQEENADKVLEKIKHAMSFYLCRRDTFVEHNFLKIININDNIQLEISSVCKGVIIVRVNNKNKQLTLFLEKSVIGIHNYLVIIDKVNKLLSGK